MTDDAKAVATRFYAALEAAWNAADGHAFGQPFAAETSFVDIRGVCHEGGPTEIGSSHQGIFDSIYKGSTIRYGVEAARLVTASVVVATARATLDAPGGPLAGTHDAVSTVVLVRESDDWRAVAFHNTLVTAGPRLLAPPRLLQ